MKRRLLLLLGLLVLPVGARAAFEASRNFCAAQGSK